MKHYNNSERTTMLNLTKALKMENLSSISKFKPTSYASSDKDDIEINEGLERVMVRTIATS